MNIKINHIAKTEGHSGFMASVLKGKVTEARMEVQEGIRLIEGVLVGRHFNDVPIVAQRICGICPIVHNLASIKAIENALGVKVSEETVQLRKLLNWAQFIHSHSLHVFFLSLADFLDIENDLILVEEYPNETKMAIKVREYGLDIVKRIGGRVVHVLTNEVGGFKKVPTPEDLKALIRHGEEVLETAVELGNFLKGIKLPDFERPTEYVCLNQTGEYSIYAGDVVSSKGLEIPLANYEKNFQELHRPKEVVKRVKSDGKTSYMIGSIARINIHSKKLTPRAEEYFESLGYKLPDFNPFHNVIYQMVEIIMGIEESLRILRQLAHNQVENALTQPYSVKAGSGVAAVEAPRGTLYYHVEIDPKGYLTNINIMTPTAQSLANMEDDVAAYLPRVVDLPEHEREKKLRALIRAYDPCISCAVH